MTEQQLIQSLRELNESELFYRAYRLARSSPEGFEAYLTRLDPEEIRRKALIIPEWPETIRQEYQEASFFTPDRRVGIHVSKHNCYTPAVPHHHDFFEMFYVLEGQCVHQVKGLHSHLQTGDICLIQPKVTHSIDVSDESVIVDVLMRRSTFRHYFYSILQGDNALAGFFLNTLYSKQGMSYLIFHTGDDSGFRHTFLDLCMEFFEKRDYYSILLNAILTKIFVLLLRNHMDHAEFPNDRMGDAQTAIRIARYLQMNTAGATLSGLAAEFHYSPEYASRLIRQTTGQTFIQLLTNIRMENAEQLLRDTSLPVADVAASVGYESSEYFIRAFRKHTGMTPGAYRQNGHMD